MKNTYNFKLIFQYLYTWNHFRFFFFHGKKKNHIGLILFSKLFYYSALHMKLSSFFFSSWLVELFCYESVAALTSIRSIAVYNVYHQKLQKNFYFFVINASGANWSVTELFANANWLEREAHELSGIFFFWKKDLRNLMLQYGDSTFPLLKAFPSVGNKEVYYDAASDFLVQVDVSMQY